MPRVVYRLGLGTAALLLLAGWWLSWRRHHLPAGTNWKLALSARHLEAGERAWVQLASPGRFEPTIHFHIRSARGVLIWKKQIAGLSCARPKPGMPRQCLSPALPFALPAPGSFVLSVRVERKHWRQNLTAIPAPVPYFGGVLTVAAVGLRQKVRNYLRAHGFAVSHGLGRADARVIVLGRTRLSPAGYLQIWKHTAAGSHLVLLKKPGPGAARFLPLRLRVHPWKAGCNGNLFPVPDLAQGVAKKILTRLLQPAYGFDPRPANQITLLSLNGREFDSGQSRQRSQTCRAMFAFRFGQGQVWISSFPLLRHFPDAWARRYFINLLKRAGRKAHAPAAPEAARSWLRELRRRTPATIRCSRTLCPGDKTGVEGSGTPQSGPPGKQNGVDPS